MSGQSRFLRGGARAVVGLIIAAIAATAVVMLGNVTLPQVARDPLAITVDTTQNTNRKLVCSGSFSELGADPNQPTVAIPTGASDVTVAGTAAETTALARATGGEILPLVMSAPAGDPLAAAQVQSVSTEMVRGVAASACTEPLNEQWLVGGGSTLGVSTTLSLANPGTVPATVEISVYDENGAIENAQSTGMLVAPGTEQTISLNGYAPDRGRLAVRVTSTGAPVAASLGVGHTAGNDPFAASWVTSQSEPTSTLIVAGVTNVNDKETVVGDAGEGDQYPVTVRVLAPGEEPGTAQVRAIDDEGKSTNLGEIELSPGAIGELQVATWPTGANAVIIDADVPVVGGVLGASFAGDRSDYEWFAPAPILDAEVPVGVPIVRGGKLVIVNSGTEDAKVELTSASGEGRDREATIPAGSAVVQAAPSDAILTSSAPVNAGVRVLSRGNISGYPIQAADGRDGELTVFTR